MKFASSRFRASRPGFTLVEILVVIGIIAALAAILFPVFGAARERARQATCLSNLRSLGLAAQMYRSDHDGHFPVATTTEDHGVYLWATASLEQARLLSGSPSIRRALSPYVREGGGELWKCPSDFGWQTTVFTRGGGDEPMTRGAVSQFFSTFGTSFFYQSRLGFVDVDSAQYVNFAGKKVDVSQVPVLCDGAIWHDYHKPNWLEDQTITSEITGKQNLLFADGHVKPQTKDQFFLLWAGSWE